MQDLYTAQAWESSEIPDLEPEHPGVYLREELLEPLGLSIQSVANDLGVPYPRMHEIVSGKRAITPETAILLAKYFKMSPQFWLGLQTQYELDSLRGKLGDKLARVRVLERPTPAERRPAGEKPTSVSCGASRTQRSSREAKGQFAASEPDERKKRSVVRKRS